MTGWRIGYVIGDPHFIKRLSKMQENIVVCACSVSQWAALEAISHVDRYTSPVREAFKSRRNTLLNALEGIPLISYTAPDATFYLFVDISKTGMDSQSFCLDILEKEHLALTPGLSFGDAFDGYVRLAFTLDGSILKDGAGRLRHYIENYILNHF